MLGSRSALVFALLVVLLAACSSKPQKPQINSVEVTPAPPPKALTEPGGERKLLVDSLGKPMSFAPLVEQSDASVAIVRAIERGTSASGRVGTLSEGLGTAFVYDPDGYLLTNHHVIEKATDVLVGFRDGKDFRAKVVGMDARTDIAVLKIEAKDLPSLPLGNSDELLVGDWVVAIGNPFGLSHSVSAGILSARGRTRDDVHGLDESGYFDFLQTDASINPGNSGGPLLNLKGEVVGINSAIRQNANSIGFAIPINMVKELLPRLLKDGEIHRSALGVVVAELSMEQAERLGRPNKKGAWVKAVQSNGPAEKGGIGVDDIIVGFNGKVIEDPNALRWNASIAGVGNTAVVRVARGKREFELKVTLGELPTDPDNH